MSSERTEGSDFPEQNLTEMNESLMLALVRQHELTEIAETLNAKLEAKIIARHKAEEAR